MIVICYAGKFGKLRKTDFHSLDPEEFGAEDAWANDAWGDEEWPSEPYQKPSNGWEESYQKPLKGWEEPLVVEKKVPVYVPGEFSISFKAFVLLNVFHSIFFPLQCQLNMFERLLNIILCI